MNNRHSENQKEINPSLRKQIDDCMLKHQAIFQPIVQTLGTSVGIATMCFPLEVVQTLMQTSFHKTDIKQSGSGSSRFRLIAPFLFNANGTLRVTQAGLFEGYKSANKASFTKNTILTNTRDPIHKEVNQALEEKELTSGVQELHEGGQKGSQKNKLTPTIVTSVLVGGLDTLFTNYFSNMRVLNQLGIINENPAYTILKKLRFGSMAFHARLLRNSMNALGCIAVTTVLEEPMDNLLPREKYGMKGNIITNIASGMIVGGSTHAIDTIYKNMIKNVDLSKFAVPGMIETGLQMKRQHGFRAFNKGMSMSMLQTIGAFLMINSMDYYTKNILFSPERVRRAKEEQRANTRATFFENKGEQHQKIDEIKEASNEELTEARTYTKPFFSE